MAPCHLSIRFSYPIVLKYVKGAQKNPSHLEDSFENPQNIFELRI